MKKIIQNHLRNGLLITGVVFWTQFSVAAYSNCDETLQKEVVDSDSELIEVENIPKGILIAREADFFSLNKNQWHFKHNFIKGKTEVICATLSKGDLSDSVFFPTLIDLSTERKTGDSFWTFKYVISSDKIGLWNQKSSLYTASVSFEKFLQTNKGKIKFYKIGFKIYRMVYVLKNGEKYFVDYDLN